MWSNITEAATAPHSHPTLYLGLEDAVVPHITPCSALGNEPVHKGGQHGQELDVVGLAPREQLYRAM